MRNAFVKALTLAAEQDERVVLVAADIGNRLWDSFKARFPQRFYNCGVCEANMTGVAAGLALDGFRPFTYTITPFVTTRCLEQIRVDLCYHSLPVVVTAVGAGLSYASLGATHHSCEDIALLRVLPEMTVTCPADSWEIAAILPQLLKLSGPAYFRLGKKGEPLVHSGLPDLVLGKAFVLAPGRGVALLGCGNIMPEVCEAARLLRQSGLAPELVSWHTVKPLDEDYLEKVFAGFDLVVTIEEHSRLGGLGSALAEWLSDRRATVDKPPARLLRLGTPDAFPHEAGEQQYFREKMGLVGHRIAERVAQLYAQIAGGPGGGAQPPLDQQIYP
jgi:transketolase